jgi:beta-mannosidase
MEKFLPKESIQVFDSPAWKAHAYSTDGSFEHSVTHYFGEMPATFEDYIFASQCSQAEAYKYLMETTRLRRDWCSGILLWNMRDAWPEMTSSLVDYYGAKKLAFYVVANANEPLQVLFDEQEGKVNILLSNDTMQDAEGVYRIFNAEGKLLAEGQAKFGKNGNTLVHALPVDGIYYSELTVNGKTMVNYFKPLNAPFVLDEYKAIMAKIVK